MEQIKIALTSTVSEGGKNVRKPTGVELLVPVYSYDELAEHSTEAAAWANDAIKAACLAKARNAGVQSAVHASIEALIAKAERSGEALKLHAAFATDFAKFLQAHAADKKQAVRDTLVAMARNKNILATSNEVRRDALAGYLVAFTEAATADQEAAYGTILENLINVCNGEAVEDADFE